jgi:hypothetical protein
MKTATVLSMTILLAACAGDRNRQAQEAANNEAEPARVQGEAPIDEAKAASVQSVEQNRPSKGTLPEATQHRAKVESAMIEDRQKFQAEARARLEQAQARLDEVRVRTQIMGAAAPLSLTEQLDTTARMTSALSTDIRRLPQISPAGWEAEKKRVEGRLDDVEKAANEVKSKADDVK